MGFGKDLWGFLKVRKKFWLLPIILTLLFFGAIMAISTLMPAMGPLYTLF
jgi:hypothetical protein